MKQSIAQVDRNFLAGSEITRQDIDWYALPDEHFEIRGLAEAEDGLYYRLPVGLVDCVNEGVCTLGRHTAGGRIRFRTDSPFIAYRAKLRYTGSMSHMPLTGSAGTDVFLGGRALTTFRPADDRAEWYDGFIEFLPEEMKDMEMGMPLYNGLQHIYVGVKAGSRVELPRPYRVNKPIVYYGSSITQGGCASKPGNSYQGFLSRWLDADQINLGFSGNGRGEKVMAEYIAGLTMSAFVMDYDYNAPTPEHLQATHETFFRIVRLAQPELPILLVSRPPRGTFNDEDMDKRREIIRKTYLEAKNAGDEKVWFVDGQTLFGDADVYDCTMDGVHPNDLGFYKMAKTLYPVLKEMLDGIN